MIQPRQCKFCQKTTRVLNPLESSRQQGSGLPATTECGSTCLCSQVSPKFMSVMLSCQALPSAQDMLPNLEGRKIHRGASGSDVMAKDKAPAKSRKSPESETVSHNQANRIALA